MHVRHFYRLSDVLNSKISVFSQKDLKGKADQDWSTCIPGSLLERRFRIGRVRFS